MDWDTAIRVFTAMGVPSALGIAWYIRRRDQQRTDHLTTDARMHEIALAAAQEASRTWKEIVEYMRDEELPALRAQIVACEARDVEKGRRIAVLEVAMRVAGVPLP